MDWTLLIGLVIFLVAGGVGSFYLYMFIVKIKKEFSATQPDLRIANLSAMNSGDVLTLYILNLRTSGAVWRTIA